MAMKSGTRKRSLINKLANQQDKKGSSKTSVEQDLKNQYSIIREDVLKLRDDLTKGVEMAKEWMEKKGYSRRFLKGK